MLFHSLSVDGEHYSFLGDPKNGYGSLNFAAEAIFASMSVLSFPLIPACLGIQHRLTLLWSPQYLNLFIFLVQ